MNASTEPVISPCRLCTDLGAMQLLHDFGRQSVLTFKKSFGKPLTAWRPEHNSWRRRPIFTASSGKRLFYA